MRVLGMPRLVGFAVLGLLAVVAVALLWILPPETVDQTQFENRPKALSDAENDARRTAVQVFGVLLLGLGGFFSARTVQVTREGHITDRYSKAVEQLGSDDLETRLGGIFALERIARNSPDDDQLAVEEVLTAYVRRHSPVGSGPGSVDFDVQGALDALGRRRRMHRPFRLNLEDCRLANTHLNQANFRFTSFLNSDLRGTQIRNTDMTWCDFSGAQLQGADVGGSNFNRAWYDDGTTWPDGFDPDAQGARKR